MTTREDINDWLNDDYRRKPYHTHMLVVVDTFDYGDYPVFTSNIQKAIRKYHGNNMQRVMEVYDLSMDFDEQLNEHRAWNT